MLIPYKQLPLGGGDIPTGYKRCLYLKSSGPQYINTGLLPSKAYTYTIRGNNDNDTGYRGLFGYRGSSDGSWGAPTIFAPGNSLVEMACRYPGDTNANYEFRPDRYDLRRDFFMQFCFDENYCIYHYDGYDLYRTQYINYGSDTISGPLGPLYLFSQNFANVNRAMTYVGRIYEWKVQDGEKELQWFIPALDGNRRPCMYDKVTRKPFYNLGEGEFTYELA